MNGDEASRADGDGAHDPGATDPDTDADKAAGRPHTSLLAALLAIDPERARTIRAGAARPRPRPQEGPSADHGD